MKKSILTLVAAMLVSSMSFAQFRDGGKKGINVFDSPKVETQFDGVKTTIGGGFTQSGQKLVHENEIAPADVSAANTLTELSPGFNLAQANLSLNSQLADGVALQMELYLSARHHNETWVKGGFLQFDKLPFLPALDNIMKYTTIKVGQYDVNYGDAHFRRTDGANAIWNPFMDNYIMDEFATELGVEAAVNYNGIVGVLALTDGLLKGSVADEKEQSGFADNDAINEVIASDGNRYPSIVAKLGYDKQLTEDFRLRITGSYYGNKGAISNTLLGGDRTGSNYFGVMYNAGVGTGTAFNGRYNPGFSDKITALCGNLFLKYKGFESFTTIEQASGRKKDEFNGDRTANQFATDLVIRFGKNDQFFIGCRYNTLTADVNSVAAVAAKSAKSGKPVDALDLTKGWLTLGTAATAAVPAVPAHSISILRIAASAGWFITDNVLTKVEYVKQTFDGYEDADIFHGAKFQGIVVQAVIGF